MREAHSRTEAEWPDRSRGWPPAGSGRLTVARGRGIKAGLVGERESYYWH